MLACVQAQRRFDLRERTSSVQSDAAPWVTSDAGSESCDKSESLSSFVKSDSISSSCSIPQRCSIVRDQSLADDTGSSVRTSCSDVNPAVKQAHNGRASNAPYEFISDFTQVIS
jgi:hypothetical protein